MMREWTSDLWRQSSSRAHWGRNGCRMLPRRSLRKAPIPPTLRVAAGADHDEPDEQRSLFRKAVIELGELPLTPSEVGSRLFRLWAQRIVSETVSPLEGARAIWTLEIDYDVVLPDSMSEYGALDESDFPTSEVEQRYEQEIRAAAQQWLAANPG